MKTATPLVPHTHHIWTSARGGYYIHTPAVRRTTTTILYYYYHPYYLICKYKVWHAQHIIIYKVLTIYIIGIIDCIGRYPVWGLCDPY